MKSYFIPNLSTEAGACITAENWQQVGVEIVSYWLHDWLVKPGPGISFLKTLPDLKAFTGWDKRCVLNASLPKSDQRYELCSSYDGSKVSYLARELLALIIQLAPNFVILPQGFCEEDAALWQSLPASVLPFFPLADFPVDTGGRVVGVYVDRATLSQINERGFKVPIYLHDDVDLALFKALSQSGVTYIESNKPALNAYHGLVHGENETINLMDDLYQFDYQTLKPGCACPVCEQQLTRASLHHLFQQTPLLCQRFLIQHQIFQFCHL